MLILCPQLTGSGLTSGTERQVSLLRKIKMLRFTLMRTSAEYVEERAATRATRPCLFFTSEREDLNALSKTSPSQPPCRGARSASTRRGIIPPDKNVEFCSRAGGEGLAEGSRLHLSLYWHQQPQPSPHQRVHAERRVIKKQNNTTLDAAALHKTHSCLLSNNKIRQ